MLLARLPCVDSAPQKRSGVSADLSVYRITGPVYTGTIYRYRYCTGTRGDVARSCEVCVGGPGWL